MWEKNSYKDLMQVLLFMYEVYMDTCMCIHPQYSATIKDYRAEEKVGNSMMGKNQLHISYNTRSPSPQVNTAGHRAQCSAPIQCVPGPGSTPSTANSSASKNRLNMQSGKTHAHI